MGGTFDVLHKGHRALLETAFNAGRIVIVGVTQNSFVKKLHKPHRVDDYELRKRELEKYLARRGHLRRARIAALTDPYGPTIHDPAVEAIVVSRRTIETVRRINAIRRRKGFRPLAIVPIDLVLAQDRRPISSTRIRRGRIDREGKVLYRKTASRKSK
jgi:pantetheine-phosphate adenylyltransferase